MKREIKILGLFLTTAYSAWVLAQAQPVANGSSLGSTAAGTESVSATRTTTTNTPPSETAPSEITTMDPMDPSRDSRAGSDATRENRRAMGTAASGTVTPGTNTNPSY